MVEKKDSKVYTLLILFSVLTVLFQTPQLMGIRGINYIIWPAFVFILIAFQKLKIEYTRFGKTFLIVYSMIAIQCVACSFFNDTYLSSNYLKITFLPLCMYWIGIQLYKWSDEEFMQRFFWGYLIATVLLAITLQMEYVPSLTAWKSIKSYLYDEKNSAAQILSSGILVSIFGIKGKKKLQLCTRIAFAFYLFVVIGLLQCRTAMLALAAAIFVYVFMKTKHKGIAIGLLSVALVLLYNIPIVNTFIRQAFLLNKYQGADSNTFSSGRLANYFKTLDAFWEHPILGNGHWYVDEFFICVLAELGIVTGGALILLWLSRMIKSICSTRMSQFGFLLLTMTIYYTFTSILEAYPPFGPGSCSFLFWIINGFVDIECNTAGGYIVENERAREET